LYFVILFFFFVGLGANLASLSPYVLSHFDEKAEWIFLCVQICMPIGTFFAGWISDKTKRIRIFAIFGILLLTPTQYFLFYYKDSWITTAMIAGFQRFLLSSNFQWISIGAMEAKGDHKYSKIRSFGTLGFLFVQLFLYTFTIMDLGFQFETPAQTGSFGAYAYLLCLIPAFFLPAKRVSKTEFQFKEAWELVQRKHIRYFFLIAFFYYSAYQITDNYLGRFFQMKLGLESVFFVWLVAVSLEIPFLLLVSKISLRYGINSLFYFSLVAGVIRFGFLAFGFWGISDSFLLFFQFPHAILFAGFYMGTILWLRKESPPHIYGSVYGLYSIFSQSMGGIFGNLICGQLLHANWGTYIQTNWAKGIDSSLLNFFPIFLYGGILFSSLLFFILPLSSMQNSYHLENKNPSI
jgi:predicted MFS family arabinose efflux permease